VQVGILCYLGWGFRYYVWVAMGGLMSDFLRIAQPDDWHVHLRDGAVLGLTVAAVARYFGRAIVMPNLVSPVTGVRAARAYRERILAARPAGSDFQPLMTLYLTDRTSAADIRAAAGGVAACKLYPAGATTNSDSGVTDIGRIYPALECMQELDLPLLVHGEVTDADIDVFDREKVFIERHLGRLLADFPELRIVFEHITTADAVQFVTEGPVTLGATITAHHLLYERNHMLAEGIRPHLFCLPVLKRRRHQQALLAAATGGNRKFFLGSDSAPHATHAKESACGCAGCYSGHAALELYAEAFDGVGALERLAGFASEYGADFYRLPRNRRGVILRRQAWRVPGQIHGGGLAVTPLRAGEMVRWTVEMAPETDNGTDGGGSGG